MSTSWRPDEYVFKNSFASSIYPILTSKQTLSLLHEINASQPAKTRLPLEILFYINEEVQAHAGRNALFDKIRDSWMPNGNVRYNFWSDFFHYPVPLERLRLDLNEKRYYVQERPPAPVENDYENDEDDEYDDVSYSIEDEQEDGSSMNELFCHISSADLLYRLLCCFPELTINGCWKVYFRHRQSGIILRFGDHPSGMKINVMRCDADASYAKADKITRQTLSDASLRDVQLLLSVIHETVDGSQRLVYFHPAANADCADGEQGYIAVPYEVTQDREHNLDIIYKVWSVTNVCRKSISSFRSILHELKYDIRTKSVDYENGTASLTTVISSAFLFYRLLCKLVRPYMHENIYRVPPITSVWQVQLMHVETGESVIFMDNRGLFDIRANRKMDEATMEDVEDLVEALCSDTCQCSHKSTNAGCAY